MLKSMQYASVGDLKRVLSNYLNDAKLKPDFVEFAKDVVGKDDDDWIARTYDYVKQNVEYVPDPDKMELFIAPWVMMERIEAKEAGGDCDDIALFTASLFKVTGHQSRILIIATGSDGLDHAVAEVFNPKINEWVMVDPSAKNVPLGWYERHSERVIVE